MLKSEEQTEEAALEDVRSCVPESAADPRECLGSEMKESLGD